MAIQINITASSQNNFAMGCLTFHLKINKEISKIYENITIKIHNNV